MTFFSDVRMSDAMTAVTEGRVRMGGSQYKEIGSIVDAAKREVAHKIAEDMDRYFSDIDMSMRDIDAIVVSGGGSMESSYVDNGEIRVTSSPMSKFLTEVLLEKYPAVDVVSHSDNPRMANAYGLFVRARLREVMEMKKAQMANTGSVQA